MKQSRTMTDILALAEAERAIVNWVLKQRRSTLTQIAQQVEKSPDELRPILTQLIRDGFISENEETGHYQIAVRTRPHRPGADQLWNAISD